MINIIQGTTNTVIATLTENVTISNPYYLLQLINEQTNQSYTCIVADTSGYPYRYNQFTITEKLNPNPLAGQMSLPNWGDYIYNFYQQASATNLDPTQTQGILETGKCHVQEILPAYTVYDQQPKTNVIYAN